MKLKVKRVRAVATWSWKIEAETCSICRQAFDACCPDCKFPGDDCPPVFGKCTHPFHMHCILKWLRAQQANEQCPLCRAPWSFQD